MANDMQVSITGYVATEPACRLLSDGRSKTTLRVASTPRHYNRKTGEWSDGQTSFVSVACWRKLAENVAMCLRKGEPVVVVGTMTVRRYDAKDGSPRTDVEVDATSIGHDLSRGVARFQRTRGPSGGTAAPAGGTEHADPMDDGAIVDADGAAAELAEEPEAVIPAGADTAGGDPAPGTEADDGAGDVLDDRAVAALLDGDTPLGQETPVPL